MLRNTLSILWIHGADLQSSVGHTETDTEREYKSSTSTRSGINCTFEFTKRKWQHFSLSINLHQTEVATLFPESSPALEESIALDSKVDLHQTEVATLFPESTPALEEKW